MSYRPYITTAIAIGIATSVAQATLLTYEHFDYTSGSNITGLGDATDGGSDAGWRTSANTTWNTAGTTGTVNASGLSYTSANAGYTAFAASGLAANMGGIFRNDRYLAIDAGGVYALNGLKDTSANNIGGTGVTGDLWGSVLVSGSQWTTGSGSQMILNLSTNIGGLKGMSIRQASAGSAIQLLDTTGNSVGAVGSFTPSASATYLIVFKYGFSSAGASDTFSVWFNPTSDSDSAAITASGLDIGLQQTEMRSVNANGSLVFDEIRLGTTFGDVVPVAVPEPSTLGAVFGVGALALAAYRRRRV